MSSFPLRVLIWESLWEGGVPFSPFGRRVSHFKHNFGGAVSICNSLLGEGVSFGTCVVYLLEERFPIGVPFGIMGYHLWPPFCGGIPILVPLLGVVDPISEPPFVGGVPIWDPLLEFQGSSWKLQGCFNEDSRVFQGSLKGVSREFHRYLKKV